MAQAWKTVRVFISSTFRDMHSERDYLVRFVFPELRERCARRRLHLVDVDLRWGVTEQEAEQGKALEVCLDEIERCRPFFVGLLGERYGWVPPEYDLPDEPSYDWVREFEPGHSITALEIYHGVLRDPAMRLRAFFYYRDPAFISEVPALHQAIFVPDNDHAKAKLERLKDDIRGYCAVRENYPCAYGGIDPDGNALLRGLEVFGQQLLEDLWSAIAEEYPADERPTDELSIERAFHEAYIEGRSQRFIGRRDLLGRITRYADSEEGTALVVTGTPGCGKSALLANFANHYLAAHPDIFVLPHFIGVSPGSTDVRRTLLRLCRELAEHFHIAEEIPDSYQELRQKLPAILESACSRAKVVLILDGLNQLDESHYAHSLHWLPQALPRGLRLIVSTLEGECLEALRGRIPQPQEIVVGALDVEDRKRIVRQTLGAYRKRLDEDRVDERYRNTQMGLLLTKRESDNPLYLIIACEELRVFGGFERVTERIASLPDDVAELFEQVLERLNVITAGRWSGTLYRFWNARGMACLRMRCWNCLRLREISGCRLRSGRGCIGACNSTSARPAKAEKARLTSFTANWPRLSGRSTWAMKRAALHSINVWQTTSTAKRIQAAPGSGMAIIPEA